MGTDRDQDRPAYDSLFDDMIRELYRARAVIQALGAEPGAWEPPAVPKVDPPANRIHEFRLNKDFQAEFDKWRVAIEEEHKGTLEITHEEVLDDGLGMKKLLIFWRIAPRPSVARRRF